jgi:hypothetical protein
VRADDDDVLQAGAKGFERVYGVIVEEQQSAVEG